MATQQSQTIIESKAIGYLNWDKDIRDLSPNELSFNMSGELFVVSESITKIKGNEIVSYNLPKGSNVCIGFGQDIQKQRGLYFLWNSNKQHSILLYTLSTNTVQNLMQDPILNFQLSNLIRKVEIVDDLVFWTDGYDNTSDVSFNDDDFNSGREISISKALAGFYNPLTLQSIQRIKYPPTKEPLAIYATDANYGKNLFNPENKLCQFAYNWEYYDASLSVYSPLSALAVSYGDEIVSGGGSVALSLTNNVIKITVNTGSYLVTKITIGVRFGNIGEFGTFITLNKAELGLANNVDYVYSFYNDRQITILDQNDWVEPYDNSPQVENTLVLVKTDSGSNLVPEQCTSGFDNIIPQIKLQVVRTDVSGVLAALPTLITNQSTIIFPTNISLVLGSIFEYAYFANNVTAPSQSQNYNYTHIITADDVADPLSFINNFYTWLTFNQISSFTTYQITQTNGGYTIIIVPIPPNTNIVTLSATFEPIIAKFSTVKSGAKLCLGIEYGRDEGWEGTVQTNNASTTDSSGIVTGTEIYVPFITEVNYPYQTKNQIKMSIGNFPPRYATKYRIMAAESPIVNFIQFYTTNINTSGTNTVLFLTPLVDYGVLATTNSAATGQYPNSILTYSYTPGDRCRLISQWDNSPGSRVLFSSYIDVEVLAYDPATNRLTVQSLSDISFVNPTGTNNYVMVEIYTPSKQIQSPIYYEFSQTYDIGDAHTDQRFHEIGDVNTDSYGAPIFPGSILTTNLLLKGGNVWLKIRHMNDANGDGYNDIVEEPNFSDFYISNSYDKGRPNVIDPYAKRQSLPIARHGNIYQPNTQINGLSRFLGGSGYTTNLNPQNGIITGSELIGYELKVYQWQKVTSIFIGRTILQNTNGTSNIAASNTFFGTHQPREDSFGTMFPESICGDHTKYFFDIINGAFVRDSENGNWDISKLYGIGNYTQNLALYMKSLGTENFNVFGYYDKKFDKVYWTINYNIPKFISVPVGHGGGGTGIGGTTGITFGGTLYEDIPNPYFKDTEGIFPLTLVFCENGRSENKGWQGLVPFHPEFYGYVGNQMLSFKDGSLYKHTDSAPKNFFYGGPAVNPSDNSDMQLEFVSNKDKQIIKTPKDIQVYSDALMFCGDKDIIVPANSNYPLGMFSRLMMKQWSKVEGKWSARFMRDTNSIEANPILNGRELKYQAMKVRLRNTDNLPLILNSVIITSLPSYPTP